MRLVLAHVKSVVWCWFPEAPEIPPSCEQPVQRGLVCNAGTKCRFVYTRACVRASVRRRLLRAVASCMHARTHDVHALARAPSAFLWPSWRHPSSAERSDEATPLQRVTPEASHRGWCASLHCDWRPCTRVGMKWNTSTQRQLGKHAQVLVSCPCYHDKVLESITATALILSLLPPISNTLVSLFPLAL